MAATTESDSGFLIPSLPRLKEELDWMTEGRCQGQGYLFFSEAAADKVLAADICEFCPVHKACREWKNRVKPTFGTWVGEWQTPGQWKAPCDGCGETGTTSVRKRCGKAGRFCEECAEAAPLTALARRLLAKEERGRMVRRSPVLGRLASTRAV